MTTTICHGHALPPPTTHILSPFTPLVFRLQTDQPSPPPILAAATWQFWSKLTFQLPGSWCFCCPCGSKFDRITMVHGDFSGVFRQLHTLKAPHIEWISSPLSRETSRVTPKRWWKMSDFFPKRSCWTSRLRWTRVGVYKPNKNKY